MKIRFFTICLGLLSFVAVFSADAANYYVVSGEPFSLKPSISTLFEYQWMVDGVPAAAGEVAAGGLLTKTFTLAAGATAETKTLSLGVLDAVGGCLSDLVIHKIIVLPKLSVTLATITEDFCTNVASISENLTAGLDKSVTNLETYGVTLSDYVWTKGGNVITGTTGNVLAITEVGRYKAVRNYVLPITGTFASDGAKLLNSITGIEINITKNKTAPTTPDITIQ